MLPANPINKTSGIHITLNNKEENPVGRTKTTPHLVNNRREYLNIIRYDRTV